MMHRAQLLPYVVCLALGALPALFGACSDVPDDSRIGVIEPDRSQFEPVGTLLDSRCGSLDCHGSKLRNLQMVGCYGRRLDPKAVPGCRSMGGTDTTEPEYDYTFRSLVGLEPSVMSTVVAGKGHHPELLSFVRKARGDEAHKGGALLAPGDSADTCITSWLAGSTDGDSCATAMLPPSDDAGSGDDAGADGGP